ncbi:MAG: hypothetical protein IT209_08590 [Armatimonadetes bacterium]|nr:hypothetical protein [Armatimonadota bacterium]
MDSIRTILLRVSPLAIRLGLAFSLIGVALLIFALATAPGLSTTIPAAERARMLASYGLMLRVLVWGVALLAIGAAVEYGTEEATGYALALVGGVIYWGVPFAAPVLLPVKGPDFLSAMAHAALRIALACWIPGALVIAYDLSQRIAAAWSGRRKSRTVPVPHQKEAAEKIPGPALACWQTDYCRPYVRNLCPRFTERKACWRKKEGCFCEEKIILRAVEIREGSKGFYDQVRKGLLSSQGSPPTLTPAQKRERCRRCPIYAQHQQVKYKTFVPVAFAATFLVLWLNAGRIHQALDLSVASLERVAIKLSFAVSGTAATPGHTVLPAGLDAALQSGIIYWGFMIFLSIMLLTWLLRFVEWLVFKVQV